MLNKWDYLAPCLIFVETMEHLTSKHTDPVQNGTPGHPQLESATNITKKKVFV